MEVPGGGVEEAPDLLIREVTLSFLLTVHCPKHLNHWRAARGMWEARETWRPDSAVVSVCAHVYVRVFVDCWREQPCCVRVLVPFPAWTHPTPLRPIFL